MNHLCSKEQALHFQMMHTNEVIMKFVNEENQTNYETEFGMDKVEA